MITTLVLLLACATDSRVPSEKRGSGGEECDVEAADHVPSLDATTCEDRTCVIVDGDVQLDESEPRGGQLAWASCVAGVVGNVELRGLASRDLTSLAQLQSITGELRITESDVLSSLDGLERLAVADVVYLGHNVALESVAALEGVQGLGILEIIDAPIATLEGMPSLREGGSVVLEALPNLRTLDGIKLAPARPSVRLTDLPLLEDLSALAARTTFQEVSLRDLPALTSLDGLAGMTDVWYFGLENVENLTAIQLPGLVGAQSWHVLDLPRLRQLEVSSLARVYELYLMNTPLLTTLDGLEALGAVEYELRIEGTGITALSGLEALRTARDIQVIDNVTLSDLSGLYGLESVETVAFQRNPLVTREAFDALVAEIPVITGSATFE